MTEEEVYKKFQNKLLRFCKYYKYTFTFVSDTEDGYRMECKFGGTSEDIYRYSVSSTDEIRFRGFNEWSSVHVYDGTKLVYEFHNAWW